MDAMEIERTTLDDGEVDLSRENSRGSLDTERDISSDETNHRDERQSGRVRFASDFARRNDDIRDERSSRRDRRDDSVAGVDERIDAVRYSDREIHERDRRAIGENNRLEARAIREQTRCRSVVERAMLSDEYERAEIRRRMRFDDVRSRFYGLVLTFDETNGRKLCDLNRSQSMDYFSSLHDMSYAAFRYFDTAVRNAYYAMPIVLAHGIGCYGSDVKSSNNWLVRHCVEEFARASYYRLYEYLRCAELEREISREILDRENYADYTVRAFARDNDRLRARSIERETAWVERFLPNNHQQRQRRQPHHYHPLDSVLRIMTCVRSIERAVAREMDFAMKEVRDYDSGKISAPRAGSCNDDNVEGDISSSQSQPPNSAASSVDLALLSLLRQRIVSFDNFSDVATARQTYDDLVASFERLGCGWPVWNLRLSREAISLAACSVVTSTTDERNPGARISVDITVDNTPDATERANLIRDTMHLYCDSRNGGGGGGRDTAAKIQERIDLWSGLSAERYDYMSLYNRNARYDRGEVRSDRSFYTDIFADLHTYLAVATTTTPRRRQQRNDA